MKFCFQPVVYCTMLHHVHFFITFSVKVGGKRVPLPKHHEEKVEAPKAAEETEEKDK